MIPKVGMILLDQHKCECLVTGIRDWSKQFCVNGQWHHFCAIGYTFHIKRAK